MPSGDHLCSAVHALMGRAREDLAELVAFPSVADPGAPPPEACVQAAEWVVGAFAAEGLDDVRASTTPDGSLAVHGHAPGPPGTPTVLLYSHYDVQPPLGDAQWRSPVWTLTERDGRWYGRGAADCKGNVVMHLTALRALRSAGGLPCGIKVVCEGSEEVGTGGLEAFVTEHPDVLRADTILIADAGNFAVGVPTLTTSLRGMAMVDVTLHALESAVHSGMFGGPAPDPVAALVRTLASLHDDAGTPTIDGLPPSPPWQGVEYPEDRYRADATVLDGVGLIGAGSVAERLWSRPAVTVIGLDVPAIAGATASVQPDAAARVSLRVPPGMDAELAQAALADHLRRRVPWGLRCEIEPVAAADGWTAAAGGPATATMREAMAAAYGRDATTQGQGGSLPLCTVLAETYPDAEILLFGVEEPRCLIHAPNESVDPAEIERIALAEALFLRRLEER